MEKYVGCALVVHPHALMRAGVTSILSSELGIAEVDQLDSAIDLLRHIETRGDWRILIVDPDCEGCGGVSGITRIRRMFPWLRIAILSESDDRDAILQMLAAGAHGFVTVQSPIEEMVVTFRAAMEGHIHVPDAIAEVAESSAAPRHVPSGRNVSALTVRQNDVVRLMSRGSSNKEIGRELNISESTVKVHVSAVFRALGVSNRIGAVAAIDGISLFRRANDYEVTPRSRAAIQGRLFRGF